MTVRYGIVGCGVIGPVHAEAIGLDAGATLVGVCDVVAARAEAVAARYGASFVTTEAAELFAREDIDAVCICLPHDLHAPMSIAALRAGKHVFCEKPPALSPADLDAMAAAAEMAGRQLGVCFQHRFDPAFVRIKELVEAGAFGRLLTLGAHCACLRDAGYYTAEAWRGTWAREGGGVLINQAIHTIDLMCWLAGDAVSVAGVYDTLALGDIIEVEDTATALVRFASGAQGHLSVTTAAHVDWHSRVHLHGTRGSAIIGSGAENEIELFDLADRSIAPPPSEDAVAQEGKADYGNSHRRALAAFTEAVRTGTRFSIGIAEARQATEVVLGLQRASREGRTVGLPLGQ
jgi:UDP-N-acetyl-2-amino-2-deoxyglucuronate dehydrogenase